MGRGDRAPTHTSRDAVPASCSLNLLIFATERASAVKAGAFPNMLRERIRRRPSQKTYPFKPLKLPVAGASCSVHAQDARATIADGGRGALPVQGDPSCRNCPLHPIRQNHIHAPSGEASALRAGSLTVHTPTRLPCWRTCATCSAFTTESCGWNASNGRGKVHHESAC